MKDNQRIQIHVEFSSPFLTRGSPSLLTDYDSCRFAGELGSSGRVSKSSSLCFKSSPGVEFADLRSHWNELNLRLEKNQSKLNSLVDLELDVSVTIEVILEGDLPFHRIPAELVRFASSVSSSIDIDVYNE